MKQYRIQLRPELGTVSSFDGAAIKRDGVHPRAFISLDRLSDGSVIAVYEMEGDPDVLVSLLDAADDVLTWDIFNQDRDETFNVYLRFDPEPIGQRLLELVDEYGLVLDMPIPVTADGSLLVTVAGPEPSIRAAIDSVPDDVRLELATLSNYDPNEHDLRGVLTDRQREVIETAIEEGYYELPREVTQNELADVFGCTPSTIGNHLRKAESRLISEIFGRRA